MMHIQKGDLVRVRQDLEYGLGVVEEQLEYRGKEFEVQFEVGYGLLLMNNPFVWKPSDTLQVPPAFYAAFQDVM